MGTTISNIEKTCRSEWLSDDQFESKNVPEAPKKSPPPAGADNTYEKSEPGAPYWNEGATDPGASYRPYTPKDKPSTEKPADTYEKSKPGESPYWNEGATDPGADYSPKNVKAKKLAMCEPIKPDGENWDEDDLGDVSDPEGELYGFAPRALEHQVSRFAADAGILIARASRKKSTPVPPDSRPNGCDGDTPWDPQGPYPERPGRDRPGEPEREEPYDLPGLPPSWDETLV